MSSTLDILRIRLSLKDNSQDELLNIYLDDAQAIILGRLYPYGYDVAEDVPQRYKSLHIEIAEFLFNKRGAEGQVSHSEGGISRSFISDGVPQSLLRRIVPKAQVI